MTHKKSSRALFLGLVDCELSNQGSNILKNLGFDVTVALSESRKRPLIGDYANWFGEYIFCFRSYSILSKELIDRASIAAINFHPAPPEYPGSGSVSWALYDGQENFGVTAHYIDEFVDHGKIIECRRFPIGKDEDLRGLSARTLQFSFDMFSDYAEGIALYGNEYINQVLKTGGKEKWAGRARKINQIDELQNIPLDCKKSELQRIVKATYTKSYPPYIQMHGYKFVLDKPNTE